MIFIDAAHVQAVQDAESGLDLHESLANAIRLEHATIPPYLFAAYTLKSGTNTPIRRTLVEIAREEMLHMAIACNTLNALGGQPQIGGPQFVPKYPSTLPMGIQGSLEVGLKKFSMDLVADVFMKIEEPENPLVFPVGAEADETFATIGLFYTALIDKIVELGEPAFVGDPRRQVSGTGAGFPPDRLFPIVDVKTARKALRWIVEDGEGTSQSPLDTSGQLAHYYRFAEIHHGKALIANPNVPEGFSYSGTAIAFAAGDVFDVPDNPKAADYAAGSFARASCDEVNQTYSDLLRMLGRAFDGEPEQLAAANAMMGMLRGLAVSTIRMIDDGTGRNVGLSFEHMPPL